MHGFTSDRELLESFRLGKPDAYREIYNLYLRQLCFFIERLTGDTMASEDIAAETFITTFNKRQDFGDLAKVKAFLFVSAGNAAKNYLKSKNRHEAIHQRIQLESTVEEESPELIFLRSEALQIIREEISSLPHITRKIISGSFIEGKSIGEIAAELKLSYKTVQNQKTMGIKMMKASLIKNKLLPVHILCLALNFLESCC